jgi:hypothetical protein
MGVRSFDKENLPCSLCKKILSSSEFSKKLTGYAHYCKPCAKEYGSKYRANNTEKLKVLKSEWYSKYRIENKETLLLKEKVYREQNKELIKVTRKKHYENSKGTASHDKRNNNCKKWRLKNLEYVKDYNKKRMIEMPDSYIKDVLSYSFSKEVIESYPELIKINREIIRIKRLCRTSKI